MTDPVIRGRTAEHIASEVYENRHFFWAAGIAAIVVGILALLLPYAATIATELLIGAVLTATGIVDLVAAFRAHKTSRIAFGVLFGLLSLGAGVLLLAYPVRGIVALTAFLAIFFLAGGLLKAWLSFQIRPARRWGWMLASAVLSIALGALIWGGLPGTAVWVMGALVGIDLIFFGATLIGTIYGIGSEIDGLGGPQAGAARAQDVPH
jgi:uncharacterized membrane protein HdeD (DUF308 family)